MSDRDVLAPDLGPQIGRSAGARGKALVVTATIAVLAALGSLALFLVTKQRFDEVAEFTKSEAEQTRQHVAELSASLRELEGHQSDSIDARSVVESAITSVVTIGCGRSLGSGFSYDILIPDGYGSAILTNHHVVDECTFAGSDAPTVKLGGSTFTGHLWSWDTDADLALIFIRESVPKLSGAPPASEGDPVVTIGSPYGFDGTVSQGIVSRAYSDGLMTDAAVDHGNSGGPLLDRSGRVLGVITSNFLGADSLNFAVGIQEACGTILECPSR